VPVKMELADASDAVDAILRKLEDKKIEEGKRSA